tara:strand:- start:154 stop:351 length:198 start_codon:yes stop_codon:yes gene_type:complete
MLRANRLKIKNLKYFVGEDNETVKGVKTILQDDTVIFVPLDEANRHYAEIKRRVDAGELTIEDAD